MKIKKTFTAKIALGFREGYTQRPLHTLDAVMAICHEYCDKIGLCVSITPTHFVYSRGQGIADGYEPGCFVSLINYPRFPQSRYDIVASAIELAGILMAKFKQRRISVITSDQTYLLEQEDAREA
jgi:hypothetical protein